MESKDIKLLKAKLKKCLQNEDYEKAARIKKWIIELGGDPTIKNDQK